MLSTYRTRLKVCCISSLQEARLAILHGADALGLVGAMPSGPGVITDELAREIARSVPPPVATFLLTSSERGEEIVEHVRVCEPTTVQIVRHIDPKEYPIIIERIPSTRRVQVIHVEDESALELLPSYEPLVHAFLLDSGRPGAEVAELGGTGRAHDWRISAEFVRRSRRPVFLAGGLGPDNVERAIRSVRPFGLDLCSGVRTNNRLDEDKLAAFTARLRRLVRVPKDRTLDDWNET